MVAKARVLVLCTGNSCRSQMAEGFLRHLAGDRFEVVSAGIEPTPVNEKAIEAMAEVGIDISTHTSKAVSSFLGQRFTHVITVCNRASERCPIFPFALQRLEWPFPDPAAVDGPDDVRQAAFRSVRDRIRGRMEAFLGQE